MNIFFMVFDLKTSERNLSKSLGLSRKTLHKALKGDESLRLSTLKQIASFFNQTIKIISYPKDSYPSCTTTSTSFKILKNGFDSWKIHLLDMVDEFRKNKDVRQILLPPDSACPEKIQALISSTIIYLCDEVMLPVPEWATKSKPLKTPWFVSGMESLKATALLESPMGFRSKNIFVQNNFLTRV